MVSEYIRGQSDLRALSLLEELKVNFCWTHRRKPVVHSMSFCSRICTSPSKLSRLKDSTRKTKSFVEVICLQFREFKFFLEVSRLKESPSLFSDADMNSAPNSPKAERREEDMKLRSQSDSQVVLFLQT